MDDVTKNKLIKFVADKTMSQAVYDILLDSFIGAKAPQDVHVLAASRLAVDFLRQGWKELEKFEQDEEGEDKVNKTPHV